MDNLTIERTKNAPRVYFQKNGNLLMEGRVIIEDTVTFFQPVLNWIEKLTVAEVNFTVKLDYLNTSASKHLFSILEMLVNNPAIHSVKVEWYYDEDDEDHLDTGKYYEESLENLDFEFIGVNEMEIAA